MKIPKKGFYFRASEEIRVTLEVLQEMTGVTMTELLESCVRIGKKTVARARNLNYQDLLKNIKTKQEALKRARWHQVEGDGCSLEFQDEPIPPEQWDLAKTKWTGGDE